MEARTMKLESRYFWIVLTFVGDSTTTSDFLATRYPFVQIYPALASPLINSALASGLCHLAQTATPAGSTQPSSRAGLWPSLNSNRGQRLGSNNPLSSRLGALLACGSSPAPQLEQSTQLSPRRSPRLRLLASASARTIHSALASALSSPAAPRQRLSSNNPLSSRLGALLACGSSPAPQLEQSTQLSPRRSPRLRLLASASARTIHSALASALSSPAAPRQ